MLGASFAPEKRALDFGQEYLGSSESVCGDFKDIISSDHKLRVPIGLVTYLNAERYISFDAVHSIDKHSCNLASDHVVGHTKRDFALVQLGREKM